MRRDRRERTAEAVAGDKEVPACCGRGGDKRSQPRPHHIGCGLVAVGNAPRVQNIIEVGDHVGRHQRIGSGESHERRIVSRGDEAMRARQRKHDVRALDDHAAIDEAQAPQRKNVPHLVRLVGLVSELRHPRHCLAVAERKRLPTLERRECIRAVARSWQFGEKAQGGLPRPRFPGDDHVIRGCRTPADVFQARVADGDNPAQSVTARPAAPCAAATHSQRRSPTTAPWRRPR